MKLETIANLAEIVGAAVVVITLIYLSLQLRQNNALLRSQSRQAQLSSDQSSLLVALKHGDVIRKMDSNETLTEDEQFRLSIVFAIDMRNREFEYLQYKEGLLDRAAWESFREIIVMNHGTKKGRRWWDTIGRQIFDAEFVADVDKLLESVEEDRRTRLMSSWDG